MKWGDGEKPGYRPKLWMVSVGLVLWIALGAFLVWLAQRP